MAAPMLRVPKHSDLQTAVLVEQVIYWSSLSSLLRVDLCLPLRREGLRRSSSKRVGGGAPMRSRAFDFTALAALKVFFFRRRFAADTNTIKTDRVAFRYLPECEI